MHTTITSVSILFAVILLMVAAAGDIAKRSVANRLSLLLALDGVLLHLINGHLGSSCLAALAVFVAAVFCWRAGLMGGGDVKLIAAAALMVPPTLVPSLVLCIAIAGGVLGLLYLALRPVVGKPSIHVPHRLLGRLLRIEQYRISRGFSLPYASAIAAGAAFVLLEG